MKVYNQDKTQELTEYDLENGYLQNDKLFLRTEPATEEIKEVSHEEVIAEYPNGGKDIEIVIDVPYRPAIPAQDIYEDIKVYIPFTHEEIERQNSAQRAHWMDIYRKYQAAVNYREIEKSREIDTFIQALKNKEWSALKEIPKGLLYFDGKCGFMESGLVVGEEII